VTLVACQASPSAGEQEKRFAQRIVLAPSSLAPGLRLPLTVIEGIRSPSRNRARREEGSSHTRERDASSGEEGNPEGSALPSLSFASAEAERNRYRDSTLRAPGESSDDLLGFIDPISERQRR